MKYILLSLFLFAMNLTIAQKKAIAFVNESSLVDSCLKYKINYQEEIDMMHTILSKKEEEAKNEQNEERKKVLQSDIEEYKLRIDAREKEVNSEENNAKKRIIALNMVQETAAKTCKKLKYQKYEDISNGKPVYYNSNDDISQQVWAKLK